MSIHFFFVHFSSTDYDDDQPPNSAISSTATPPLTNVIGHRFFGPDFNIEQLRGNFQAANQLCM